MKGLFVKPFFFLFNFLCIVHCRKEILFPTVLVLSEKPSGKVIGVSARINFLKSTSYLFEWFLYLVGFLKLHLKSSQAIKMENIALRSQLALYVQRYEKENIPKPTPTPAFRQLWVLLSKNLANWKEILLVVKPDAVIRWHRIAFKMHWKRLSEKTGRPTISPTTIQLIKCIYKENPLLSPEKIHERMLGLGIEQTPAPNTIAKYLSVTRKPPSDQQIQSWKTFLNNHHHELWATDFFTMPTYKFQILYGLIIIHHQNREIVYFASPRTLQRNGPFSNLGTRHPLATYPSACYMTTILSSVPKRFSPF